LGAQERAKITYSVEHNVSSTGEDPFTEINQALGRNMDPNTQRITNDLMEKTATKIRYSTGGTVVNMPIGATLKAPFDGKQENSFKDFYQTNFDVLCATIGIPPEVALNKYTSSFSASRGANKNWEHKILFERTRLSTDIYQPFYNFWLELEIYSSHISIPKYVTAKIKDDFLTVEAIQGARFVGVMMPFIDPLKEVQAVRAKLGDQETPLCDYDDATEELGAGDWDSNIIKASLQKKKATDLGFANIPQNTGFENE
jgi:capsid protein